jgi:nucleoside-diphosphate-sugar epimerase
MRVLVLGGTGAMGVHLVKLLSNNGVEIIVTSRSSRECERNVKYVQGNAHDIEFLKTILNTKWDAIIDFMVYTTTSFNERIDLLLESTSQYVFISTARVYAEAHKPIIENSNRLLDVSLDNEFLATDEYSLTKARQENILSDSKFKNWTIIRPYITYSESRMQLGVLEKEDWLYRALRGRTIVFSKDIITKLTTLTFGLDVSEGIVALIGNRDAFGEAFHITSNTANSWDKILTIYLDVLEKHLGCRPKIFLQDLESFFTHHPVKYQVLYDRIYNRQFDNSKICKYLDVNRFTSIDDGLKRCLEDFLKNPTFNNINWRKEALKDKYVKESTSLTEIDGVKNKIQYLLYRYFKKISND